LRRYNGLNVQKIIGREGKSKQKPQTRPLEAALISVGRFKKPLERLPG
jgi:hypothetical protein